jgi:bifunctional DNA-binding transcriptional regulator/antitoxin component of YhaV-PrlF toxin-antitoxin module
LEVLEKQGKKKSLARAVPDETGTFASMKQHKDLARVIQIQRLTAAMRPTDPRGIPNEGAGALSSVKPRKAPRRLVKFIEGAARLDASGRMKDAEVFDALGWTRGNSCYLSMRLDGNDIIVRRSATKTNHRLDSKGRVTLPKSYRILLGLRDSSLVVMAANKSTGDLTVMRSDVISKAVA